MEKTLVSEILENAINSYKPLELNESPTEIRNRRLPKICTTEETKEIIRTVNEVLSEKIPEVKSSILKLHTLIYCGAQTVVKICKIKKIPVFDQNEIPKTFPKDNPEAQAELFQISPQKFRKLLFTSENPSEHAETPPVDEIETFWAKLWENSSDYNEEKALKYIQKETERMRVNNAPCVTPTQITKKDLKKVLKKKKNWSPSGIDGLQPFWYKQFSSLHKVLAMKINEILHEPEKMPSFFTQGFTELFPKTEDTRSASKYRPITHLPTIYKIITRCIYEKIFAHYENCGILADEQCGGRKGYYGVRKALVIDSVALGQKTVWGCYVDYKKAFDMIPHKWVLKMLKVYEVDDILVNFLKNAMTKWQTRLYLDLGDGTITRSIQLKRGIFQGDSLSVLFYWTAVNPLSFALHQTNLGLSLKNKILSHLLYMDDLKLYSSNVEDLKQIFQVVIDFSKAISMKINYEKSHVFSVPNQPKETKELNFDENIKLCYSQEKIYLGYKQYPKIQHETTIYRKAWSFEEKLKKIEATKISDEDKQKIKNMVLITSIYSSFGVLHWTRFKRKLLEVKINRKKLLSFVRHQNLICEDVYLKLLDTNCKMRRHFCGQKAKSNLIKMISENDTMTPLKLSITDDEDYIKLFGDKKCGYDKQNKKKTKKKKKTGKKRKRTNYEVINSTM